MSSSIAENLARVLDLIRSEEFRAGMPAESVALVGVTKNRTVEEIEEASNLDIEERYPYLEAKANGIIAVDGMVACVYPADMDAEVTAFLKAIGFTGLQVPLDVPYVRSVLDAEVTYAWSWAVHDALVSLQQAHPVELG